MARISSPAFLDTQGNANIFKNPLHRCYEQKVKKKQKNKNTTQLDV